MTNSFLFCDGNWRLEVICSFPPAVKLQVMLKVLVRLFPFYFFGFYRHNDLPWQLLKQFNNQLTDVDLNKLNTTHTNIPKIKEGRLGAQVRTEHGVQGTWAEPSLSSPDPKWPWSVWNSWNPLRPTLMVPYVACNTFLQRSFPSSGWLTSSCPWHPQLGPPMEDQHQTVVLF